MKKALLLLLALILCLSMTACNSSSDGEQTDAAGESETTAAEKTTSPGKIENDIYSNDYISFKVPAGFTAITENGSDYLAPATPNGDGISVLFSEKNGSFDALNKEDLEAELKTVIEGVAIDSFVKETIDGTDAVRFSYTVDLDALKLNITQIILNTEANITLTITDCTGTYTADFASLASSIDVK